MLLEFTIENWKSFRDPVTFSMIAGSERRHNQRLTRVKFGSQNLRVLPISAIFGANASGKSNFVEAIGFAKDFITDAGGIEPEFLVKRYKPFLLDDDSYQKPTEFSFTILIDQKIYKYRFAITVESIVKEELLEITTSWEEAPLFSRDNLDELKDEYIKNISYHNKKKKQLLLPNIAAEDEPKVFVDKCKKVYDWFHKTVTVVRFQSHFFGLERWIRKGEEEIKELQRLLESLDTGIGALSLKKKTLVEGSDGHRIIKEFLLSEIKKGGKDVKEMAEELKKGVFTASIPIFQHQTTEGIKKDFEEKDLSHGTRRLLNILPALILAKTRNEDTVFIIDELDNSVHTLLCEKLINYYLGNINEKSRSQMIFTTHDILLMNQDYMRRDELWFAERDERGASELFSLAEFKDVRFDKNLQKDYLIGRFGGTPRIRPILQK
jgi:uncharacterized protein